jgi:hypothetical protein
LYEGRDADPDEGIEVTERGADEVARHPRGHTTPTGHRDVEHRCAADGSRRDPDGKEFRAVRQRLVEDVGGNGGVDDRPSAARGPALVETIGAPTAVPEDEHHEQDDSKDEQCEHTDEDPARPARRGG